VDSLSRDTALPRSRPLGVTIAVCCHNSARRLPETLRHLLRQQAGREIEWEVLAIDNGSTDETAQVARRCWPTGAPAPLRIAREETVGLSRARKRAFIEAAHEIVCFVDDDNWLCPEWVATVSKVMSAHPDVAVCGGPSVAVFEEDPPEWFERFARSYAVGPQGTERGYHVHGFWGAGLVVRKSAWEQLYEGGFEQLLPDRVGGNLSSGGDTELCLALMRLGWKQWYEPDLRLQHYIPGDRTRWKDLRRLHRGFGAASVTLAAYRNPPRNLKARLGDSWLWHLQAAWRRFFSYRRKFWRALQSPMESDREVIELEHAFGRLVELSRQWRNWHTVVRRVQIVEDTIRNDRRPPDTEGARRAEPDALDAATALRARTVHEK
jgi:glycosyltransferase involved in cell wall biosynthesis